MISDKFSLVDCYSYSRLNVLVPFLGTILSLIIALGVVPDKLYVGNYTPLRLMMNFFASTTFLLAVLRNDAINLFALELRTFIKNDFCAIYEVDIWVSSLVLSLLMTVAQVSDSVSDLSINVYVLLVYLIYLGKVVCRFKQLGL